MILGPLLFLVMMVPFTINGLGVREAFFVAFLGRFGVGADAGVRHGVPLLRGDDRDVAPGRRHSPLAEPAARGDALAPGLILDKPRHGDPCPAASCRKGSALSFTKMARAARNLAHGRGRLVRRSWQYDPALYAPARHRRACSYDAFVPDLIAGFSPVLEGALAGVVSDAEARIIALNASARPALTPFSRLLLRTESIASSKVEGMQVEARSLAHAEARQETGRHVGSEAAEILANIDAMQLAVEEASAASRVTVGQIVTFHRALLERSPNVAVAGRVRTSQNWIGGNDYNPCSADFVPPPHEEVPALLEDLVSFCNADLLPPLVQAAVAHAQFETIHPFDDGNGRTGRALVQVILRRRGLAPAYVPPISVVLAAERDRYVGGLTSFRDGRESEWIEIFAVAAACAADLAVRYLAEVAALQERWRSRLRDATAPRSDAAAWTIIEILPAHPVISVPVGVAATGRSKPAVDQAIRQLADAGVLLALTEGRRNRSWEAAGLLDLLGQLETALPRRK